MQGGDDDITIAMLWFALGASIAVQIPETPPQTPPGFVKIDGSVSPEAIPDWAIWRTAFGLAADPAMESLLDQVLELNQLERAVLVREASLQRERDEACIAAQEDTKQQLDVIRASDELRNAESRTNLLRCRQDILDASERVVGALTDEGRTSVEIWLRRLRQRTVVHVPEADHAFYGLPR